MLSATLERLRSLQRFEDVSALGEGDLMPHVDDESM
eukprot:CAMPEP_0115124938 /NCGR_PEP_ID=MMETSP0227-20121206/48681_1 /TAXON_ID=89957 /ORGANISM="Polarella glacialis, Strain CCMP 1383" /LENGTH=35 /DNA_ID= /DNA_START= /DNA_END= /DNA_ORIENTATION=